MTPPDPDEPFGDLTPEDEDRVSALLGSVPPPADLPEDVAARLDARLVGLVSERSALPQGAQPETARGGPADELAGRRMRVRKALLVAASIAVIGIGAGAVLDNLSAGSADSATAGAVAEDEGAPEAAAPDEDSRGEVRSEEEAAGGAAVEAPADTYLATVPQVLSRATLAADVRRLEARAARVVTDRGGDEDAPAEGGNDGGPTLLRDSGTLAEVLDPCAVPTLAADDRVAPATLDGERVTLVLRAPRSGTSEAEIYSCDRPDQRVASTVVPAG